VSNALQTPVAPPKSGFSLGKIWTDKRSRGVIIQIIAMAAFFAAIFWLLRNAVANFETLGKPFGFDFLWQESNYDINQHLIEYDSQSSHFRAGVVGVLNTLLVAACGIVLSTILGFILGVLRLSPNWLVNRLSYCYIEFVRNVPVLVHILLIHGILVHALPGVKAVLRAASDDSTQQFFLTNRGFYVPRPIFESGIWLVVAAIVAGIGFAIWYRRQARIKQANTGEQSPVFWMSLLAIIGLPIVAYFLAGQPIQWDAPQPGRFNFKGGMALKPEFLALWLALSLYTAAFIAENVRSGIEAINKGQTEAAHALGLPRGRTMNLVIIPQALRVIIPPLTSQYLNITKNSSLAIAIGYMDIVATIGGITLNQTGREMECMIIVLSLYLLFSLTISLIMNWYNKRMALVER
jgi:general L-amino acid transport system permease protein